MPPDNRLFAETSGVLEDDLDNLGITVQGTYVVKKGGMPVSSATNFPANLQLMFERDGKFVKTGTGAINFLGNPFKSYAPPPGIFEGFAEGDITFADPPKVIKTEWWKTNNNSLIQKLSRADKSAANGKNIVIEVSPDTIDGQIKTRYDRKYLFKAGEYQNTWAGSPTAGLTASRTEPFIYTCPEYHWVTFEWEDGVVFHLSDSIHHKNFLFPADEEYFSKQGRITMINVPFVAQKNMRASGGRAVWRIGNCQEFRHLKGRYIGTQDYFTLGGDPRDGHYAENALVKDMFVEDHWNYALHNLNVENATWEDVRGEVKTLQGDRTMAWSDDEPNTTEERLRKNTYRRVFFFTNQGTAIPGNPNRRHNYYQPFCFIAQAAATDGIYEQTYDNCGYECPSNDFNSVQSGIYAEGHYDLKINDFNAKGGTGNYLFYLIRCGKARVINPQFKDGYSGEIRVVGCARTTIIIPENSIVNKNNRKIVEMEFGLPVLVNGNEMRMLDSWVSNYGRPYKFFIDLYFDFLGQRVKITGYTTTRNITNYPFKRLNSNTSTSSRSSIQMTSISGNIINSDNHGIRTGEPLDYTSSGTHFEELKNYPYIHESFPSEGLSAQPRRVYGIRVNDNQLRLAKTIENAVAGTAIPSFSKGSGNHSLQRFHIRPIAIAPVDVDVNNNRVYFPNHNLAKGTPVQYRNYGGKAIGGLYKAATNSENSTRNGEVWFGFYHVFPDPSDPTNYLKFSETKPNALKEFAIDLTNIGSGHHYVAPVIMTDNSETNVYVLPSDYAVERRNPLSKSKNYTLQNYKKDALL